MLPILTKECLKIEANTTESMAIVLEGAYYINDENTEEVSELKQTDNSYSLYIKKSYGS